MLSGEVACPCCGNKTLDEPGGYLICPVCYWEDDPAQSNNPDLAGGANPVSLNQAKKNFKEFGACEMAMLEHVLRERNEATSETWNKLASQYQEKFMHLDLYNDTYDAFCQLIEKKDAAVLEIGCGPGNATNYILSKRPDLKLTGTDVAPAMIELAKQNNPSAHFEVMDCKAISFLVPYFDAILCGFVMPYLSKKDCFKLLKDSHFRLNPNGIIYISVIEGGYQKSGYETSSDGAHTMYVYYHQEDQLLAALEENGFECLHIFRKVYPKTGGVNSTHLIFIARKM